MRRRWAQRGGARASSVTAPDGTTYRVGELVTVRGQEATVFEIFATGGMVTIKDSRTGLRERVGVGELRAVEKKAVAS